jgi:hypothetical protein
MAQQAAVEWLWRWIMDNPFASFDDGVKAYTQAKAMEKEQRNKDYNAGYTDAQCNHINDAENYANEIDYLQSRIDEIDSKIKAKQNSIADMLINGNTNNK